MNAKRSSKPFTYTVIGLVTFCVIVGVAGIVCMAIVLVDLLRHAF